MAEAGPGRGLRRPFEHLRQEVGRDHAAGQPGPGRCQDQSIPAAAEVEDGLAGLDPGVTDVVAGADFSAPASGTT